MDYRVGDVRARLAEIPDGTISLVASSPPFVALRSYLPADHPDKHLEIGSEPDPASFLDTLLALTAEWGRVLAPWGSIAIELGDTYAGSGGAGGDYNEGGLRDGQAKFRQVGTREHRPERDGTGADGGARLVPVNAGNGWPRAKCLALVPQLYAASLAYGRNLLTGQPSPAGQWLVRNMIVWHRSNPAVGALGDKVRPSTSYIVVATRSPKRWFDLTAVRTAYAGAPPERKQNPALLASFSKGNTWDGEKMMQSNPAGAPPLDCWFDEHDEHDTWTITTQPSKLAHYAMWPPKLAERLILMMCPLEVCATCGEPRRRIERYSLDSWRTSERVQTRRAVALADAAGLTDEHIMAVRATGTNDTGKALKINSGAGKNSARVQVLAGEAKAALGGYFREFVMTSNASPVSTWTSCPCADYRPGVVLDPFCGTGTSLCVAELHGRDSIGVDLDARNRDLVPARMGECRRALFGTQPELPGQLGFDLEVTA